MISDQRQQLGERQRSRSTDLAHRQMAARTALERASRSAWDAARQTTQRFLIAGWGGLSEHRSAATALEALTAAAARADDLAASAGTAASTAAELTAARSELERLRASGEALEAEKARLTAAFTQGLAAAQGGGEGGGEGGEGEGGGGEGAVDSSSTAAASIFLQLQSDLAEAREQVKRQAGESDALRAEAAKQKLRLESKEGEVLSALADARKCSSLLEESEVRLLFLSLFVSRLLFFFFVSFFPVFAFKKLVCLRTNTD